MDRCIGVVRKFIHDRGFGFLKVLEMRDDGKPAQKPAPKRDNKQDQTGLARLLRKRRPTGGFVMLSGYARLKGTTGIR